MPDMAAGFQIKPVLAVYAATPENIIKSRAEDNQLPFPMGK